MIWLYTFVWSKFQDYLITNTYVWIFEQKLRVVPVYSTKEGIVVCGLRQYCFALEPHGWNVTYCRLKQRSPQALVSNQSVSIRKSDMKTISSFEYFRKAILKALLFWEISLRTSRTVALKCFSLSSYFLFNFISSWL